MKQITIVALVLALAMGSGLMAAQMQYLPLHREMNLHALDVVENFLYTSTEDTLVLCPDVSQNTIEYVKEQRNEGIVIDVMDDEKVNIILDNSDLLGDPAKRIFLNEKSLYNIM